LKKTRLTFISLLLFGLSLPAAAAVNAWLDRNLVAPGESVQLTLLHDGRTDSQPDLSPLNQDFDILRRSSGSSIQIINGRMSATAQVTLTLAPKHGGKLQIPALQWDGQYSPSLLLVVSGNGASASSGSAAAGKSSHLFITTTLDEKQPYVQAAVTLTVRIYADEPLYQASLDLEPGNDVLVQQLGTDSQTTVTRNGQPYQMIERKYLLFPQRSGEIKLDGPVLDAQEPGTSSANPFASDPFFGNMFGSRNPFAGMMNSTRPVRMRGNQIVMNVRPRPAGWTGHDWLPAQKVALEESWQPADGPIHPGDPITRHVRLSAYGLTAPQLPDLSALMSLPQGLRAYPDQPKLNTANQRDGVVGTRDQDIALIASQAGHYVIPALHLSWWDTSKNTQREVDLPAHTLEVLPGSAAVGAGTAPPPDQNASASSVASAGQPRASAPNAVIAAQHNYWPWIGIALAMLWLSTVFAWWFTSRRNPVSQTAGPGQPAAAAATTAGTAEARDAFRQACRDNNPQSARRHLLDWARAVWPSDPPIGLKALAEHLDDADLKPLLSQLDRACYAGGEWRGEQLLEKLKTLSHRNTQNAKSATGLAGLYP
jgi:hypothetical protein